MGLFSRLFAGAKSSIPPKQAYEAHAKGAILVDVRENNEWEAGHAPKVRHIPLSRLGQRARELPKNRPVVLVCRSGSRSAQGVKILAGQFDDLVDVKGGMNAWVAIGLPVVTRGGGSGRII